MHRVAQGIFTTAQDSGTGNLKHDDWEMSSLSVFLHMLQTHVFRMELVRLSRVSGYVLAMAITLALSLTRTSNDDHARHVQVAFVANRLFDVLSDRWFASAISCVTCSNSVLLRGIALMPPWQVKKQIHWRRWPLRTRNG